MILVSRSSEQKIIIFKGDPIFMVREPKQDSIFAYIHANDFMKGTKGYIKMDIDLKMSILMSPEELIDIGKQIYEEQERLKKLQREKRGTKIER